MARSSPLKPSGIAKTGHKSPKTSQEKRLRRFRDHAPGTYCERLERACSQRMFVIDRVRTDSDESPEEVFEMAGTTGNVYRVKISLLPSCTCPDSVKGNQCKHIIYVDFHEQSIPMDGFLMKRKLTQVLHNVLKAPLHLEYQLAFLRTELLEIFAQAPLQSLPPGSEASGPSQRKPVEGDCPICFTEFETGDATVFCRASCGNNVHLLCFEQWAKAQMGNAVRCVYCRATWQGDEEQMTRIVRDKIKSGHATAEGYVNVARELGISGARDYSTYHRPWVNAQFDYS